MDVKNQIKNINTHVWIIQFWCRTASWKLIWFLLGHPSCSEIASEHLETPQWSEYPTASSRHKPFKHHCDLKQMCLRYPEMGCAQIPPKWQSYSGTWWTGGWNGWPIQGLEGSWYEALLGCWQSHVKGQLSWFMAFKKWKQNWTQIQ